MATAGATSCSARVGSYKEKKNWREVAEDLRSSVDRARFLRRVGSVLTCNLAALKLEVEKINAGWRQQSGIAVGYCSCGAAYPSRVQRGGNCEARRCRQRTNLERLRDERAVSRTLSRALNPCQGGSAPRTRRPLGSWFEISAYPVLEKKKQICQKRTTRCMWDWRHPRLY